MKCVQTKSLDVQVKCCMFGQSHCVFGVNAVAQANSIFGISVNIYKYVV